jgi:hypothetical protein
LIKTSTYVFEHCTEHNDFLFFQEFNFDGSIRMIFGSGSASSSLSDLLLLLDLLTVFVLRLEVGSVVRRFSVWPLDGSEVTGSSSEER